MCNFDIFYYPVIVRVFLSILFIIILDIKFRDTKYLIVLLAGTDELIILY